MSADMTKYLRKTVSFQVYPSAYIGNDFNYCKVASIMDAATAAATGYINPPAAHQQCYPTIPTENLVSDDYDSYNYVKLIMQNGEVKVIGEPWIIEATIEEFSTGTITMTFLNKNVEDLEELKRICSKNGYIADKAVYKEN